MWSQLFATLFLKERFSWPDGIGTLLIAGGATTAAVFGAAGAASATNSERFATDVTRFQQPLELAALAADLALIAFGITYLLTRSFCKRNEEPPPKSYSECLAFSCVGGLFGCWSATTAKLVVTAVSNSISGTETVVTNYAFWLCLAGLAGALIFQIGFLNGSLKRYDALTAVPPYECMITLGGVASGWLFLGEADNVNRTALTAFFIGCAAAAGGIMVMSLKPGLLRRWPTWNALVTGAPPLVDLTEVELEAEAAEEGGATPASPLKIRGGVVSSKSLLSDVYGRRTSDDTDNASANRATGLPEFSSSANTRDAATLLPRAPAAGTVSRGVSNSSSKSTGTKSARS